MNGIDSILQELDMENMMPTTPDLVRNKGYSASEMKLAKELGAPDIVCSPQQPQRLFGPGDGDGDGDGDGGAAAVGGPRRISAAEVDSAFGDIVFSSNFDSGNMDRVEQAPADAAADAENGPDNGPAPPGRSFRVWIRADCAGTEHETNHTTWFYFSVCGGAAGERVSIELMNMNNVARLYREGFRPVTCSDSAPEWRRIGEQPAVARDPVTRKIRLRFPHECSGAVGERTYFAFCYPFSYRRQQQELRALERACAAANATACCHAHGKGSEVADADADANATGAPLVFFQRELLVRSGRNVQDSSAAADSLPLGALGQGAARGAAHHHQVRVRAHAKGLPDAHQPTPFCSSASGAAEDGRREPALEGLFPVDRFPDADADGADGADADCADADCADADDGASADADADAVLNEADADTDACLARAGARVGLRPPLFPKKRVAFVSARVHPGETPASFVLEVQPLTPNRLLRAGGAVLEVQARPFGNRQRLTPLPACRRCSP
jgi:hypothetical protein